MWDEIKEKSIHSLLDRLYMLFDQGLDMSSQLVRETMIALKSIDYGWVCPKCGEVSYGHPRKCKHCAK